MSLADAVPLTGLSRVIALRGHTRDSRDALGQRIVDLAAGAPRQRPITAVPAPAAATFGITGICFGYDAVRDRFVYIPTGGEETALKMVSVPADDLATRHELFTTYRALAGDSLASTYYADTVVPMADGSYLLWVHKLDGGNDVVDGSESLYIYRCADPDSASPATAATDWVRVTMLRDGTEYGYDTMGGAGGGGPTFAIRDNEILWGTYGPAGATQAGVKLRIYYSDDYGEHFYLAHERTAVDGSNVIRIHFHAAVFGDDDAEGETTAFFCTGERDADGVLVKLEKPEGWTPGTAFTATDIVTNIGFHQVIIHAGQLYMTSSGRICRCDKDGTNFEMLLSHFSNRSYDTAVAYPTGTDPVDDDRLLYSHRNNLYLPWFDYTGGGSPYAGIHVSADGGLSWSSCIQRLADAKADMGIREIIAYSQGKLWFVTGQYGGSYSLYSFTPPKPAAVQAIHVEPTERQYIPAWEGHFLGYVHTQTGRKYVGNWVDGYDSVACATFEALTPAEAAAQGMPGTENIRGKIIHCHMDKADEAKRGLACCGIYPRDWVPVPAVFQQGDYHHFSFLAWSPNCPKDWNYSLKNWSVRSVAFTTSFPSLSPECVHRCHLVVPSNGPSGLDPVTGMRFLGMEMISPVIAFPDDGLDFYFAEFTWGVSETQWPLNCTPQSGIFATGVLTTRTSNTAGVVTLDEVPPALRDYFRANVEATSIVALGWSGGGAGGGTGSAFGAAAGTLEIASLTGNNLPVQGTAVILCLEDPVRPQDRLILPVGGSEEAWTLVFDWMGDRATGSDEFIARLVGSAGTADLTFDFSAGQFRLTRSDGQSALVGGVGYTRWAYEPVRFVIRTTETGGTGLYVSDVKSGISELAEVGDGLCWAPLGTLQQILLGDDGRHYPSGTASSDGAGTTLTDANEYFNDLVAGDILGLRAGGTSTYRGGTAVVTPIAGGNSNAVTVADDVDDSSTAVYTARRRIVAGSYWNFQYIPYAASAAQVTALFAETGAGFVAGLGGTAVRRRGGGRYIGL